MKFKDLELLGFKKECVSFEESGGDEYFYYTYDFFDELDDFCLISSDNSVKKIFVEIFNTRNPIRYYKISEVKMFIDIIKKGIK
jgi:hypothetical protein